MNGLFQRIKNAGAWVWIKFVQYLNGFALALGALIISLNQMYPSAVNDLAGSLPPMAKLALLAAWSGVVHYALSRANKQNTK